MRIGRNYAVIADLGRMLRDGSLDQARLDVVDDRGRSVEGDDLDLAGLATLLNAVGGAEGREQVGAEHTHEIGVASIDRLLLRGGLVGVVVVELRLQDLDARMSFHLLLETLLALVGRRDAGLDVGHIHLALVADRLGKRPGRHPAAQEVVGRDVGEREVRIAGAGLVIAGADERIDGDDRNAGVGGLLKRLHQLGLVGRRDQDRIGLAGDDGVEHRCLLDRVELGRALEHELRADRRGGRLRAFAHGDVERIGGEARHERDSEFLAGLCRGWAR